MSNDRDEKKKLTEYKKEDAVVAKNAFANKPKGYPGLVADIEALWHHYCQTGPAHPSTKQQLEFLRKKIRGE